MGDVRIIPPPWLKAIEPKGLQYLQRIGRHTGKLK